MKAVDLEQARAALIDAGRQLSDWELVIASSGNLSMKVGDHVLVSGSGTHLDRLEPGDLVLIDVDGRTVDGTAQPTSETPLHLAVYAATDAEAIAHTHATASAAISCVDTELPALHYMCLQLGGPVRVAPYATYGTPELANSVVAALGADRSGALMANHGSIAYGTGQPQAALDQACERLRILEWLCELHIQAHLIGTPQVLSTDQLDEVSRTTARMRAERQQMS
ncbi:MAG: class II aldolase/adducin family protein [Actinomycetia bacterium]|nr:class II aldolase/adducin family protein [Actinomycetes bacterium]MCP4086248.1 class II aldolase/adducin family protein [Actinomycetes bacterium]